MSRGATAYPLRAEIVSKHRKEDTLCACSEVLKATQTFSMSSMQAARSIPKSMNSHSMPSFLYSSCSSTNMWWLKNCCSFSLVKLMHSCSRLLNYNRAVEISQVKWIFIGIKSNIIFNENILMENNLNRVVRLNVCI